MVSAIILTKNEEGDIGDCIRSLRWCDEIIIVDDYSQDKTTEKCKILDPRCKIYERHLNADFAQQRNFGMEQARGEWVLFVDADERVTKKLAEEILRATAQMPSVIGFRIKRDDYVFGKWLKHGETRDLRLLRLVKKGRGKWVRPVHEVWQVKGKMKELKNPLLHYPHPTVKEFLENINFYTDLNAQTFYRQGVKTGFVQILAYPAGKFIVNYFFKLGFLDGVPGLLMATFMSFHSFLTRAKLWLLWQKNA